MNDPRMRHLTSDVLKINSWILTINSRWSISYGLAL